MQSEIDALRIAEGRGDWLDAADGYRRLIGSSDLVVSCRARARLAHCLLETGHWGALDEADDLLVEATKVADQLGATAPHWELLLERARLDDHRGQAARAIAHAQNAFKDCMSKSTECFEVELCLASLERRRGELRACRERLERLLETQVPPGLAPAVIKEYGSLLLGRGEAAEAIKYVEVSRTSLSPQEISAARLDLLLADAYLRNGQRAASRDLIESSIREYDQAQSLNALSEAHALLGLWFEEGEDYFRAAHHYREAYDLDRSSADRLGQARAKRRLGRVYRKKGDANRARELFADSKRLQPAEDDLEAAALFRELSALALTGPHPNYEDAIRYASNALAIAEEDGDERVIAVAKRNLARAYREDDQLDEAEALLTSARLALAEREDLRELDDLLDDLGEVYLEQSRYLEAERALQESLEYDERLGRVASRGRSLLLLGRVANERGNRDLAGKRFDEAIAVYRAADHQVGLSDALRYLGCWHLEQGRLAEARRYFTDSLEIDTRLNDYVGRARAHRDLATVARLRGDLERSLEYLTDCRRDLGTIDDPIERALTELEQGRLELASGNYAAANDTLDSARSTFLTFNRQIDAARCVRVRALAVAYQGQCDEALASLAEAHIVFKTANDAPELDELFDDMALVHLLSGNLDDAEASARESIDVGRRLGWSFGKGRSLLLLAAVDVQRGNFSDAKNHLDAALATHTRQGDVVGQAETQVGLGDWHSDDRNPERNLKEAARTYKEARRQFQVLRDLRGVIRCNRQLGRIYIEFGELSRAEEALDDALDIQLRAPDARELGPLQREFGRLRAAQGRSKEAQTHFRHAITGFRDLRNEADARSTCTLLIAAHQACGEIWDALECIREMGYDRIPMFQALLRDLHPDVAACADMFTDGKFDDAVRRAFVDIEVAARRKVLEAGGNATTRDCNFTTLVTEWQRTTVEQLTESEASPRSGHHVKTFCGFWIGATDLLRNRTIHGKVQMGPEDAFAALLVAHLIRGVIDKGVDTFVY